MHGLGGEASLFRPGGKKGQQEMPDAGNYEEKGDDIGYETGENEEPARDHQAKSIYERVGGDPAGSQPGSGDSGVTWTCPTFGGNAPGNVSGNAHGTVDPFEKRGNALIIDCEPEETEKASKPDEGNSPTIDIGDDSPKQ